MMIFISGASRSGKSEEAEKICMELAGRNKKIYIATAQVYDDDMRRRVERHKFMRRDKNFFTIEKTHNLHEIFSAINNRDTVLLECLPNWVANELFIDEKIFDGIANASKNLRASLTSPYRGGVDEVDGGVYLYYKNLNRKIGDIKNKIFKATLDLNSKCTNLIIVSDDIFSDGIFYDDITESYIKLLAELHILIAAKADKAIECASGLAYYFKN